MRGLNDRRDELRCKTDLSANGGSGSDAGCSGLAANHGRVPHRGNLAAALCAQADTAAFYDTGVVTFSDEAKRNVLQVRAETLAVHSAVSEACVQEMSAGILAMADADIAIAISGYAGPEGGEDGTPAGTVWFAWNFRGQTETKRMCFAGDCETVVAKAVRYALAALSEKLAHWQ